MASHIEDINDHEIIKKDSCNSSLISYNCSNDNCDLRVYCMPKDIDNYLILNKLKSVSREVRCPCDTEQMEEVAKQKNIIDYVKESLN